MQPSHRRLYTWFISNVSGFIPRAVFILLVALAAMNLYRVTTTLGPPVVYDKDFAVWYLTSRAIIHGDDPYRPLPELAEAAGFTLTHFPHPSPYPPPGLVLGLPFAILPYEYAAVAWFLFDLLSLFFLARESLKAAGAYSDVWASGVFSFLALAWQPVFAELALGQFMFIMGLLFFAGWRFLRNGKDVLGGIFLGLALSIKLMGWPIVLFLILRRRFKSALAACLTVILTNVLAGAVIGFGKTLDFYLRIGPEVGKVYRASTNNFSAWASGFKLFGDAPLAYVFSALAVTLLIGSCVALALRSKNFDVSYSFMLVGAVFVGPIAWMQHLPTLALPLAFLAPRLRQAPAFAFAAFMIPWLPFPLNSHVLACVPLVLTAASLLSLKFDNH